MLIVAVCMRMAITLVMMRVAQNRKFFEQEKRQQSA